VIPKPVRSEAIIVMQRAAFHKKLGEARVGMNFRFRSNIGKASKQNRHRHSLSNCKVVSAAGISSLEQQRPSLLHFIGPGKALGAVLWLRGGGGGWTQKSSGTREAGQSLWA